MLDGMMNQALKIVSNILLFVTSFFVISHLLLDSVISMNYWSISLNLSLFLVMLFLAKYINDLFFLGILKFRRQHHFCAYSLINTSALFAILWYPM